MLQDMSTGPSLLRITLLTSSPPTPYTILLTSGCLVSNIRISVRTNHRIHIDSCSPHPRTWIPRFNPQHMAVTFRTTS